MPWASEVKNRPFAVSQLVSHMVQKHLAEEQIGHGAIQNKEN